MKTHIRLIAFTALAFVGGWFVSRIASPTHASAAGNRVFELRVYHTNPDKVPALIKLFEDATIPTFKRHHIESIGYWVPRDQPNTWIYVVAHQSREEATKNWAAFQADPEWQQKFKVAQANGALVQKIDSTFMDPAEFSPLK